MKSLVCISNVPDTTTRIKYTTDGKSLDKTGVTFVINPYDEFGLVRAIELKEKSGQGEITAFCVGGADVETTLRKALAIGADNAVRIDTPPLDSRSVAEEIAAYAKGKGYDLIYCGKESIDHNGSAVGAMLAALLGLPFVSFCTKLNTEGGKLLAMREIDGGMQKMESGLPAVVSCQKGMAEWRIPNMRGIMAARTKPLQVLPSCGAKAYVSTVKLESPPEKGGCKYVNAAEAGKLAELLHENGLI